jgi:hypothetical protein
VTSAPFIRLPLDQAQRLAADLELAANGEELRPWVFKALRDDVLLAIRACRSIRLGLVVRGVTIELSPNQEVLHVAETLEVGQTDTLTLVALDQHGQPMTTQPTPDAAPVWTSSTPATETVAAAANGLSAAQTALAVGSDTVSVALAVNGTPYSATLAVTVAAAPQVLTSFEIQSGTPV